MKSREYYFSYFWPLKIEYLYPSVILKQPFLILGWSFVGSLVAFPLLAYFLGKRFYCSWVCRRLRRRALPADGHPRVVPLRLSHGRGAGTIQKFGRFRITVKKDMCISCRQLLEVLRNGDSLVLERP